MMNLVEEAKNLPKSVLLDQIITSEKCRVQSEKASWYDHEWYDSSQPQPWGHDYGGDVVGQRKKQLSELRPH